MLVNHIQEKQEGKKRKTKETKERETRESKERLNQSSNQSRFAVAIAGGGSQRRLAIDRKIKKELEDEGKGRIEGEEEGAYLEEPVSSCERS